MLRRLLDTLFARTKPPHVAAPSANYSDDRETDRVGQLSADDRAWEAASQERQRETTARTDADPRG